MGSFDITDFVGFAVISQNGKDILSGIVGFGIVGLWDLGLCHDFYRSEYCYDRCALS